VIRAQAEAEAILLADRFPPPSEEELSQLPACVQEAYEGRRKAPIQAVAESRRAALVRAESALDDALRETHLAKSDAMMSDHANNLLDLLQDIRKTLDSAWDACAVSKQRDSMARPGLANPRRGSVDPLALISQYAR
jgi:hypothetical protein